MQNDWKTVFMHSVVSIR